MKVSLQIVEQPEDCPAPKRVVVFSDKGGRVGRSFDCELNLPSPSISREQARIEPGEDGFSLVDNGRNPIQLNERYAPRGIAQPLYDGDVISIAGFRILLTDLRKESELRQRPERELGVHNESSWGENVEDLGFSDPTEASDADLLNSLDPEPATVPESRLDYVGNEILSELASSAVVTPATDTQGDIDGDDLFSVSPDMEVLRSVGSMSDAGDQADARTHTLEAESFIEPDPETRMFHNVHPVVIPKSRVITDADYRLYERLLGCIDSVAEQFVAQFDPDHLESLLLDHRKKRIGREKWLWQNYRSYFSRKMEQREYQTELKSLLLEKLRTQIDQGK